MNEHLELFPGGGSIWPMVRMIEGEAEKLRLKMSPRRSATVLKGKTQTPGVPC